MIHLPAFASIERFSDEGRVAKRTHERGIRNRLSPKIQKQQCAWVFETPVRRIPVGLNNRVPFGPMRVGPAHLVGRFGPTAAAVQKDRVVQLPYALTLTVPLYVVPGGGIDVPEIEPRFFQATREATGPTSVHPKDTGNAGHLTDNHGNIPRRNDHLGPLADIV
jgi:hypothetical protein